MRIRYFIGLLSLLVAAPAFAELPSMGKVTIGDDFRVTGYLDTYIEGNFNTPPNSTDPVTAPQNRLRAFDQASDQFTLNAVELGLHHGAKPVGFDLVLGAGTQLKTLNSSDPSFANIRTADAMWSPYKGWMITVGRFDANFGLESIDSASNWNYSRSNLFSLVDPMTYAGAKVAYDFAPGWNAALGVANGSDVVSDNNRGKTFLAQVSAVNGAWNGGMSYTAGPEQPNNSTNWRQTVGANGSYAWSHDVKFGLDAAFQHETNAILDKKGDQDTNMDFGGALYGAVSIIPNGWESLRAGWMHDTQGAATLTNESASLLEVTLTHRQMITKNLSAWLEVRYDDGTGTDQFMDSNGSPTNLDRASQVTATGAVTLEI